MQRRPCSQPFSLQTTEDVDHCLWLIKSAADPWITVLIAIGSGRFPLA
jgi:hypothetical protein